jgi:hypothetical protein
VEDKSLHEADETYDLYKEMREQIKENKDILNKARGGSGSSKKSAKDRLNKLEDTIRAAKDAIASYEKNTPKDIVGAFGKRHNMRWVTENSLYSDRDILVQRDSGKARHLLSQSKSSS